MDLKSVKVVPGIGSGVLLQQLDAGGNSFWQVFPFHSCWHMGVSINGVTPKMNGLECKHTIKTDDLGAPLLQETSVWFCKSMKGPPFILYVQIESSRQWGYSSYLVVSGDVLRMSHVKCSMSDWRTAVNVFIYAFNVI